MKRHSSSKLVLDFRKEIRCSARGYLVASLGIGFLIVDRQNVIVTPDNLRQIILAPVNSSWYNTVQAKKAKRTNSLKSVWSNELTRPATFIKRFWRTFDCRAVHSRREAENEPQRPTTLGLERGQEGRKDRKEKFCSFRHNVVHLNKVGEFPLKRFLTWVLNEKSRYCMRVVRCCKGTGNRLQSLAEKRKEKAPSLFKTQFKLTLSNALFKQVFFGCFISVVG